MLNKKICKICINKNRRRLNLDTGELVSRPWEKIDDVHWENNFVLCPNPNGRDIDMRYINGCGDPMFIKRKESCPYYLEHLLKSQKHAK